MGMRGFKFVVLSCLLVSLASAEIPVHLVGQLGGQSQAIAISQKRSIAYLGVGPRVVILDVSDPNNVREIAQSQVLPEVVEEIVIRDRYAYVADGYAGLYIMDISDVNAPTVVGRWNHPEGYTFGRGLRVCLSGHYAYFADGSEGLHVIDISNPTEPNRVSVITEVSYSALAVSGGYAYTDSNTGGIAVIDISNPIQPTMVPQTESLPWPRAVKVIDGYAYIVGVQDDCPGLYIIDASDPHHLSYVGRYEANYQGELAVDGKRVYVGNGWQGVDVIRISNPRFPSRIGQYETVGFVEALTVSSGVAYIAGSYSGLEVLDLSSLTDPITLGCYITTSHQDVAVSNSYAYLASAYDGLQIVDISDPAEPAYVSWLDLDFTCSVAVGKSHVFVGDGWKFKVIDTSNPLAPVVIGWCGLGSYVDDITIVDRYAYIASGQGMAIIDVYEPYHPVQVGWADASGYVLGVCVSDGYAYVSGYRGLDIMDISSPTAPLQVGRYLENEGPFQAAVSGCYAFLANGNSGIQVLDISDPFLPGQVGSFAAYYARDIVVHEQYGLFLDYFDGLGIIDISNPAHMVSLGESNVPGYNGRMALVGQYAYIASGSGGFNILKIDWPEAPNSDGFSIP